MLEITLPDQSKRKFNKPISIEDLAVDIGPGLAKATVAGRINGVLVDASEIITKSENLTFKKTNRSEERRVGKECRSRWSPYH